MSEPLYDIYFQGQLVAGANPETVRKNLMTVFKADAARVETLLNGQAHCIKKDADRASAEKYQAILQKAGAVIEIRPQGGAAPAPAPARQSMAERLAAIEAAKAAEPAPAPKPAASTQGTPAYYHDTGELAVAPPGSYLLHPEERKADEPAPAAAAAIKAVAESRLDVVGNYERLSPELPPAPPPPATDMLSVADSYERLSAEAPPPPPAPDTDFLSIAETGARLGPEMEDFAALEFPELDSLEIAPAGSDLLRAEERKADTAIHIPDISHLSIKN